MSGKQNSVRLSGYVDFLSGCLDRLLRGGLVRSLRRFGFLGSAEVDCRFQEGLARQNGSLVKFGDAIKLAHKQGMDTKILQAYYGPKTQPLGTGGDMHFAFSYATQVALVSVDLTTGEVKVHKIISAADVGRAINPLQTQGQIEGGIVMALGNCLTEAFIVEDGVPWSTLLARYKMPSIKHTPEIISHIVEHPTADGPYGAKGVGELPSINTSPFLPAARSRCSGIRTTSTTAWARSAYESCLGAKSASGWSSQLSGVWNGGS